MKEVQIIKASKDKIIRSGAIIKNKIRVAPYARVSTDSDEQKNSYESQKKYYQELVSNNPEWEPVDIHADEAISGTQVYKRTDFIRMINDAMEGKIDMIITKSISRFARNTLDTLSYVRQLKDKDVAVFFEKENINYHLNYEKEQTFKNITTTIINNKYVIISKIANPAIHFVIKHPKLVEAIDNFNPLVKE